MMEYSVKPPTIPIPFHKLLKVVALVDGDNGLELRHEKSNLVKRLDESLLFERNEHGIPVPLSKADRKQAQLADEFAILNAIRTAETEGVTVPASMSGPNNAAQFLATRKEISDDLANDRGRGMVIALNKTDLLSKKDLGSAEQRAREKISFAPFVPVVLLSAKTGRGVAELFATIDRVGEAFRKRVSTGELNRFFEQVLETRPPPTSGGRAPVR